MPASWGSIGRRSVSIAHAGSDGSKPAIPPPGCEGSKPATYGPGSPGPEPCADGVAESADGAAAPNPAIPPSGADSTSATPPRKPTGRPSECEPYREIILAKLDQELTAQRICQDLVAEHGFTAKYDSVKRYVRKLGATRTLPWRRIECAPGVEAQVDFGTGAPLVGPDGKRRKTYVFRIVLSHSRKGYSEATERQTTEDFLRCLENAFAHFGGVVETLVIDYVAGHIIDLMLPISLCARTGRKTFFVHRIKMGSPFVGHIIIRGIPAISARFGHPARRPFGGRPPHNQSGARRPARLRPLSAG